MNATYTLAATGLFRRETDGVSFRFHAGDIIPLELAVQLGMPGAALPAASDPFSTDQSAWLEARLATLEASLTAAIDAIDATIAALTLADLVDVTITAPADGDLLTFEDTGDLWVNTAPTP